MTLFTSKRERRLWLWTLAVLVAIFSTLGLAGTLAETLRNRGMLDDFFFFCFILVLVIILAQGLTTRPGVIDLAVVVGVAIVYFMVFLRMGIPIAERTHLIEYGVVAILIYQALTERLRNGRKVPSPAFLTMILTALLGLLDECIQFILPNRVFDIRDVGFNALAGAMAILASLALTWARRRLGKADTN